MHREIERLVERQAGWAGPLGARAQQTLARVLNERPALKDALNGTWLGHPVHPAVTDVAVGGATMAVVLDIVGMDRAADVAIGAGLVGMAASAATGAADAVDSYGEQRNVITLHALLNTVGLGLYATSFLLRLGPRGGRPLARLLGFTGFGILNVSAYLGGDIAYGTGSQVDRHAFDADNGHDGTRWHAVDVAEVPAGRPLRANANGRPLVLYRETDGGPVLALDAVCAHAGGPLDKGSIADGCVICPWHGSTFRLTDGHVVHGPSVYDQPAYDVRVAAGGTGLEVRRRD